MDTPTSTRPSSALRTNVTNNRTGNKIPTPSSRTTTTIRVVHTRTTILRTVPNMTPVALNPLERNHSSSSSSGTPPSQRVEHPYSLPPAHQYTNNQISHPANTSNTPQKCDNNGGVQFSYEMTQTRQEGTINRYWISAKQRPLSASLASKTPISYRHLIDLTSSNIQCTDTVTGQEFLCKIVNEPMHKVQRAYFALKQDSEGLRSSIYGHTLIRGVHDIVPLSANRTYIIISPKTEPVPNPWDPKPVHDIYNNGVDNYNVYEDLHTYIRNNERLCEAEARYLFHQICQTVQVCHRNGIILRDLKLKRFFFIDEARTKLQYESLEGSMILSDLNSDVLSDKIGCPLYTAPELLCPNPTYHGKPADMWSLGVILYTMLVGQYPFYEKGNCNLITVIRHCHVQIPSSLSRSVRWLLLALLRKNYEERMTASQIFVSPWLKEQRPFYTYIPVDVEMSDSEMEDNENEDDVAMDSDELINEDDTDLGVQPLDYTSATLSSSSNTHNPTSSSSTSGTSNTNSPTSISNSSSSSTISNISSSSSLAGSTAPNLHVRSPSNNNSNAYQNIEMDPVAASSVIQSSTGSPDVRLISSSYNCIPSTSQNIISNSNSENGTNPYGFPTVSRSNTGLLTILPANSNADVGNYASL